MKAYNFNENIQELEIDPQSITEGLNHAQKKGYTAIRIYTLNANAGKTYDLDLSPFSGKDFVTSLSVSDSFKIKKLDFDALYNLKHLKKLSFDDKKFKIDFAQLPQLETLYFTYNDDLQNIAALKHLHHLLIKALSQDDCSILTGLTHLKELRLSGGSFTSLSGIEGAPDLQDVNLNYCTKLTDITAIRKLAQLNKLQIEKCKNLTDFPFLANNDVIKELFISELHTLSFVPSMKKLEKLKFWDLKDGDISPVLKSKSLKEVDFYPSKKHYSHTKEEIKQLLKK
ncbi:internalin A [Chitinophaga niastensis]|uniref:Internalin A n=1 Tax=Chitinophaga niastensis TaxID=536980 RepID=A0A2P8HMU6_CHINA|nr:leucine-rich repeat domain-containing protein [Chitinophaga niastensis]PSL47543.1 internalin A [Chitinophaga niastensis]